MGIFPVYTKHKDHDWRVQSAITVIQKVKSLSLYPAYQKSVINLCLWQITEANGKYETRYWSKDAVDLHRAYKKKEKTKYERNKELQHEHVSTRKELTKRILSGENIKNIVNDAVACVVSTAEHKALSKYDHLNGWQRYKQAKIRVFDALLQQWVKF